MSIRVIIADDHPVVRDGLRLTIERSGVDIVVVGEASDGLEILKMAGGRPADVFILDITMPNLNGIETARELVRKCPAAKVIMLSLHDTRPMVEASLAAGARGYLTKEMATRNVVEAVTEVHAGHFYLCPRVAHFIIDAGLKSKKESQKSASAPAALTGRERKVLQMIAEGRSNKEIATLLDLSANTVHVHRTNMMSKLNIHKNADLVRYAIKTGVAKL